MDAAETTRRRSINLLLLVVALTAFAGCLGYELNWISERQAALAGDELSVPTWDARLPRTPAPLALRLLGQRGYGVLFYSWRAPDGDFYKWKRLFPEANVQRDLIVD